MKNKRTLAIGDIHGYYRHLEKLLEYVNYSPKDDRLIFLGDYIDRGENPKKTLDLIINLLKENSNNIALMGNHEDIMLSILDNDGRHSKSFWLSNGADSTLSSFGLSIFSNLREIDSKYIYFLESLKRIYIDEKDKIIYVHAGIDYLKSPHKQDFSDINRGPLWIRDDFIDNIDPAPGYMIIFGHTPSFKILNGLNSVYWSSGKIGIDTGLCYGFSLTALEIKQNKPYKAFYIDKDFKTGLEYQP